MSKLTLPLPPSVNHYLKRRGNRTFKSEAAIIWQANASAIARNWWGKKPLIEQKCVLSVWVYWPDKRIRDCDNLTKCLADALTGIVWVDDHYVLPQYQDYEVDRQSPRVEIEICVKESSVEGSSQISTTKKVKRHREKNKPV